MSSHRETACCWRPLHRRRPWGGCPATRPERTTVLHWRANKSITRICSQTISPCVCVLSSNKTRRRKGLVLLVMGQIMARSRVWLYLVWLITTAGRYPACSLPFVGSKSTKIMSPCFKTVHALSARLNFPNHICQARRHNPQDTSQEFF